MALTTTSAARRASQLARSLSSTAAVEHTLYGFIAGTQQPVELVSGLGFAEGPRWCRRRGALLFSDMPAQCVWQLDGASGVATIQATSHDYVQNGVTTDRPSGLGALPSGELLVVAMDSFTVAACQQGGGASGGGSESQRLVPHANLLPAVRAHDPAGWARGEYMLNDAVCDACGNMYVGLDHNGPKDSNGMRASRPSPLFFVNATSGSVSVAAADTTFANGCVLEPTGHVDVGVGVNSPRQRLILAETYAQRITVFDVDLDHNNMGTGALHNRRVWAELPGIFPDGICLDAEGCLWVGVAARDGAAIGHLDLDPGVMELNQGCARPGLGIEGGAPWRGFLRLREGGCVLEAVQLHAERMAIACVLGGDDGRTLFMLEAFSTNNKVKTIDRSNSRVCSARVRVPAMLDPSEPRYCAGYYI